MVMARSVDRVEMELVNRGEGFFHVGGAGHEAAVGLVPHLIPEDYLYPHYRDKSLMLARGVPAEQFFHGLLCTAGSTSDGRQMGAHLSVPDVRILPMTGPVGNNALPSVGVAREIVARARREAGARNGVPHGTGATNGTAAKLAQGPASTPAPLPLVLCSGGDSATQQGEFMEAVAEAVRAQLPVLFLIEDNGYAISTRTAGNTFYKLPSGPASEFYGLPVERLDGRDVIACEVAFGEIVARVRQGRPALVVMEVDRLTHHTNADDERIYRSEAEIREARANGDPIARLRARLLSEGVSPDYLNDMNFLQRSYVWKKRVEEKKEQQRREKDEEQNEIDVLEGPMGRSLRRAESIHRSVSRPFPKGTSKISKELNEFFNIEKNDIASKKLTYKYMAQ